MATTVAQRIDELNRAEAAREKAAQDAAKRASDEKRRRQAMNDVALQEQQERQARGYAASDAVRLADPVLVTVGRERLKVHGNLSNADQMINRSAEYAVRVAINRVSRWATACEGAARARALGDPTASAASAEEVASFLADEDGFRQSMK